MNRVTPEQPVPVQYDQLLLDLKARQQAGEHMPCPRCGKDTMKPGLHTNALSRHADLYVCDQCGTAEAMLDFMNNPLPLTMWAICKPLRPASGFGGMTAADMLAKVMTEQLHTLIAIYKLCEAYPENRDEYPAVRLKRAAEKTCTSSICLRGSVRRITTPSTDSERIF